MSDPQSTPKPAKRGSRLPQTGFGVLLVGMSVAIWWPAFTLGAWGTLFFDQLLTIWAAATAALVVVLIKPQGFRHRWIQIVALSVPTAWLLIAIFGKQYLNTAFGHTIDILVLFITLVSVPFIFWTLMHMIWPDLFEKFTVKGRIGMLVIVAVIAGVSYLLGTAQQTFLNCEDFDLSGNSRPPNCVEKKVEDHEFSPLDPEDILSPPAKSP